MKNEALSGLEVLIGDWDLTMTDAWFLDSPDIVVKGTGTFRWLGDAFIEFEGTLGSDAQSWRWVIGRNDARKQLVALYHDERGVLRVFDMTFGEGRWALVREDPDFHQRLSATMDQDRMVGRTEASEDAGLTWRKDFDLVFERKPEP